MEAPGGECGHQCASVVVWLSGARLLPIMSNYNYVSSIHALTEVLILLIIIAGIDPPVANELREVLLGSG